MAVDIARQQKALLPQIQQQRQTAADSVDAVNSSYIVAVRRIIATVLVVIRGGSGGHHGKPSCRHASSRVQHHYGGRRRCGHDQQVKGSSCPAQGKVCYNCGKANHFKVVCRLAQKVNDVRNDSEPTYFLGSLDTVDDAPPWRVSLPVGKGEVSFKIDTRADVSIISEKESKKMYLKPKLRQNSAKQKVQAGQSKV